MLLKLLVKYEYNPPLIEKNEINVHVHMYHTHTYIMYVNVVNVYIIYAQSSPPKISCRCTLDSTVPSLLFSLRNRQQIQFGQSL